MRLNAVSYYETKRGLLGIGVHWQLVAFERLWRVLGIVITDHEALDRAAELYAKLWASRQLLEDAALLIGVERKRVGGEAADGGGFQKTACHSEDPNTLRWDLSCGMNRCAHSGSRAPAVRGLADEWGQTNKSFVCPHSSAILEVNGPARVFRPLCRVSAFQRPPMSKIGHVHWQRSLRSEESPISSFGKGTTTPAAIIFCNRCSKNATESQWLQCGCG